MESTLQRKKEALRIVAERIAARGKAVNPVHLARLRTMHEQMQEERVQVGVQVGTETDHADLTETYKQHEADRNDFRRTLAGILKTTANQERERRDLENRMNAALARVHGHLNQKDIELKRLREIKKGDPGEPGEPGRRGKSIDHELVISEIVTRGLLPQPTPVHYIERETFDKEKIFEEFVSLIRTNKLLNASHIKGLQGWVKDGVQYRFEELMHGGGSGSGGLSTISFYENGVSVGTASSINIIEGDGVDITMTKVGDIMDIQFDATATSGDAFFVEDATGTLGHGNRTFVVTQIPKFIIADGETYFEGDGYSRSGLTLTLDVFATGYVKAVSGSSVYVEDLDGTIDGSNGAFLVTRTPSYIASDGAAYIDGGGYSISGNSVSMTIPPNGFAKAISGLTSETPQGSTGQNNFTITSVPAFIIGDQGTYFADDGYSLTANALVMTVAPMGYIKSITGVGGGSSGGAFSQLYATEIPNGAITVFTFASAGSKPSFIISDNVLMRDTTASGVINWTWDNSLKQATMLGQEPQEELIALV